MDRMEFLEESSQFLVCAVGYQDYLAIGDRSQLPANAGTPFQGEAYNPLALPVLLSRLRRKEIPHPYVDSHAKSGTDRPLNVEEASLSLVVA
jgi:hypothetical protein